MTPDLSTLPACTEKWEGMEILPDGRRLCARCNHPVTDFRGMTTEEISLVHALSDERVCGVYTPGQLGPERATQPRRRSPGLVTLALGASLLGSRAEAQVSTHPAHEQAQQPARTDRGEAEPSHRQSARDDAARTDSVVIHGTVRMPDGSPVRAAIVLAEGTRSHAVTDSAGGFVLRVDGEPGRPVPLRVDRIGIERWTGTVVGGDAGVIVVHPASVQLSFGIVAPAASSADRRKRREGFSVARINLSGG